MVPPFAGVRKKPSRLSLQSEAPATEVKPGPRALQNKQLVDPATGENLPASHSTQESWPVPPWAVPGGQTEQLVEPMFEEKYPDAHAEHEDAPGMLLAKPASQLSHDAWPVPPCAEPAGQEEQIVEPTTEEKVPDEHAEHEDAPKRLLMKPAVQLLHDACPVPL